MSKVIEEWETWEGRVVDGKFPLRQWLGSSGLSAVFLTERREEDRDSPRKLAIKLTTAEGEEAERQLLRWRAAAQLSHPHLIQLYEAGRCRMNGTPVLYLVMEGADEDLAQILPQRPLTPAEVGDLIPPLLDALEYLHGKGFVHGRIRPSNVLAVGDQLKLSTDHASPPGHAALRRPRDIYDAPETVAGVVSSASDLWSVGVTLVTALTQDVPFSGEAMHDPDLPRTMPEPFRGIARECLHLDPKRRCSIEDIVARMQPAARSVPAESERIPPPKPTTTASGGPDRARTVRRVLIPIVVLILFVLGVRFFYKGVEQKTQKTPSENAPSKVATPADAPPPFATPTTPKQTANTQGDVLHQVLPEVPQSARNTITGKIRVIVRVDVDPSGKVTGAKLTSPGPSRYFANLALKAAQRWEFSPPLADGQPTASAWVLRFRFGRAGTTADPERVKR
jgi:TonB family protein